MGHTHWKSPATVLDRRHRQCPLKSPTPSPILGGRGTVKEAEDGSNHRGKRSSWKDMFCRTPTGPGRGTPCHFIIVRVFSCRL